MAFFDYSDAFTYTEKIVLDWADETSRQITQRIIAELKTMTDGMQSCEDDGLENIWEEICVQLQMDFSVCWGLYDEIVRDLTERALSEQSQLSLAALQYSIDFSEQDDGYEYNPDEITDELTHVIYNEAANDRSANITAFLENERAL